jgi:hypothetical protein
MLILSRRGFAEALDAQIKGEKKNDPDYLDRFLFRPEPSQPALFILLFAFSDVTKKRVGIVFF